MIKLFKIFEYDNLIIGEKDSPNDGIISKATYYKLLELYYKNPENNKIDHIFKRKHNSISSQNYVGTLFISNQIRIEILPKIYRNTTNPEDETKKAIGLITEMLQVCRKINPKEIYGRTSLDNYSSIFEIYITLFCKEVNSLIKRGLRSSYINVEENTTRFTGKILFQKHLTTNFIHKERVYISHDIFDVNRPENRLIKSALLKIKKYTNNDDNKRNINILLSYLDEVEPSSAIDSDFAKCYKNANNREYEYALIYAKLFLKNLTFNLYDTSKHNYAFLFPMDRLFEEYVYHKLDEFYRDENIEVNFQANPDYLFQTPKEIQLRPDIIVKNKKTKEIIIYDTKRKKIDDSENKVSVGDFYQMYVYHKRISKTKKVILLYPFIEDECEDRNYFTDFKEANITIRKIKLPISENENKIDFESKFKSDEELLNKKTNMKEEISKLIEKASIAINKPMREGSDYEIVYQPLNHKPLPLPSNKIAVYTFCYNGIFLKIGQANINSGARYQNQHYLIDGSNSTLAKSLASDQSMKSIIKEQNISDWIKQNCERYDVLFDSRNDAKFILNFIEGLLHYYFNPKYEK